MKPHSYHLLGFFVSHLANFFLTYFSCYSFVLSVTVCILFISSSQYFLQLLTFIFQIIVNTSIPFLSFFAWKNNFSPRPKLIFMLKSFLELYITLFSLKSQAYSSISFGSNFVAISSIPRSINSFLWFLMIIRYLKRENIDWYQHWSDASYKYLSFLKLITINQLIQCFTYMWNPFPWIYLW